MKRRERVQRESKGAAYATAIEDEAMQLLPEDIDKTKLKTELLSGGVDTTQPLHFALPTLDPSAFGYRPVAQEHLFAVHDNIKRVELKRTGRYLTKGMSLSIPIVKGIRYRAGGGSIATEKSVQVTAVGRLLLTDKAIIFESAQTNERITWGQIANVTTKIEGFEIAKRNGPLRTFIADKPDPHFAAIIQILLSRRVHRQSAA